MRRRRRRAGCAARSPRRRPPRRRGHRGRRRARCSYRGGSRPLPGRGSRAARPPWTPRQTPRSTREARPDTRSLPSSWWRPRRTWRRRARRRGYRGTSHPKSPSTCYAQGLTASPAVRAQPAPPQESWHRTIHRPRRRRGPCVRRRRVSATSPAAPPPSATPRSALQERTWQPGGRGPSSRQHRGSHELESLVQKRALPLPLTCPWRTGGPTAGSRIP